MFDEIFYRNMNTFEVYVKINIFSKQTHMTTNQYLQKQSNNKCLDAAYVIPDMTDVHILHLALSEPSI